MKKLVDFYNFLLDTKTKGKIDSSKKDEDFKKIYEEIIEFKENINDPYYTITSENILAIFKISWLEDIDEFKQDVLYYLIGLFFFDSISFSMYRSIIQELQYRDYLSDEFRLIFYWVYSSKQENYSSKKINDFYMFLEFCRETGIEPANYENFEKIIIQIVPSSAKSSEQQEKEEEADKCISNLLEREEYVEEISSLVSSNTIDYLDFHVNYNTLNQLAYFVSKRLSSELSIENKLTIAEFQKKVEEKFESEGFPLVPTIVDPIIQPHRDKVSVKSVQMEKLATLPKELITEFALIRAYSSPSVAQKIRIIFLGGGGIGTMGIIIQHDNNAILLDFGMSVANNAIPNWHPSLQFVNAVLLSHAHLDHSGGLPYIITPENGKRWYASPSTKILTEKLLFSTVSIIQGRNSKNSNLSYLQQSYLNPSNLINLFNSFNPLKPKETVEISPGFEVTPYPASHLFGSYGYEINVFGKRIFFTGDFSLDSSELFPGAKFPRDCDITIFDGTYYNRQIPSEDPNITIMKAAEKTDRLIIPAFSLGRTQEMIRRLERLGITKKKAVKTTGLAADITKTMGTKADYDIVRKLHPEDFEENQIIVAGHGMLNGGTARNLVEATKNDEKTGILLCGYQAPNTLGYALKTSHPIAKQKYHQEIFVSHISGHTTPSNLNEFILDLKGKKIMVHNPEDTKLRREHKDILIPSPLQKIEIKNS